MYFHLIRFDCRGLGAGASRSIARSIYLVAPLGEEIPLPMRGGRGRTGRAVEVKEGSHEMTAHHGRHFPAGTPIGALDNCRLCARSPLPHPPFIVVATLSTCPISSLRVRNCVCIRPTLRSALVVAIRPLLLYTGKYVYGAIVL